MKRSEADKQLNNLLELAHINRDRSIVFANVRIDEIVFDSIHQIKNKYQGRKIIPIIKYPEIRSELNICGDEGLLTIAFNNLLDNACKFSNNDVFVDFSISEENIKIIISDSGIGIPSGEIESIFNPFKRATNVKFINGFGIGLSLVVKIMDLHKAKLKVYSKEKTGTEIVSIFKRVI